MSDLSEKLSFTLEEELGGGEGRPVPDEVQLLPAGEVNPKGKTGFLVDEEARGMIVSAFTGSATDLVVDYEHQSLSGSEAPAAGWIKELVDRGEDGIWAKVQWTERAKGYLEAREYRYLSPVVLIRKKDRRAVEVLGAALTNLPAIDGMAPVVNSSRPLEAEEVIEAEDAYREMYMGVLKAVGLQEGATPADVEEKVVSLHRTIKAMEAESLIREALSDGRLTPSLAGWARGYAAEDPEGFRDFMGKACPVVPLGRSHEAPGITVDRTQREVNRLLGISDETFTRWQ